MKVTVLQGDVQTLAPCDFVLNQWYLLRSDHEPQQFACRQSRLGGDDEYVILEQGHFSIQKFNTGEDGDYIPVEMEVIFITGVGT